MQGPDTESLGRKGGGSREIMVPENNQGEEPRKQYEAGEAKLPRLHDPAVGSAKCTASDLAKCKK